MKEGLLGVNKKTIQSAIDRFAEKDNDAVKKVRGVMAEIKSRQPHLYNFLSSADEYFPLVSPSPFPFALGAGVSYLLIEDPNEPVTPDVIATTMHDVYDHIDEEQVFDFSWFWGLVSEDSPLFTSYIDAQVSKMDENNANDFLFGILAVALPFYKIREAQAMEEQFFGDK